jgi:hypothetical protein
LAGRIASGLLVAMAGLIAMGAAPAPGPVPEADQLAAVRAAIAKALPAPRMFRVTRTGGMAVSVNALEMCLGAGFLSGLIAGSVGGGADASSPGKGCTHSYTTRRGGGFHLDLACDRAAGAARTTHTVLDGTAKDMRQAMELVLEDPQSGDARIVSVDLHMTDIGACPAGMAPGQVRGPDGKIADGPAAVAGAARR